MRRVLGWSLGGLVGLAAMLGALWWLFGAGWLGNERDAGTIRSPRVPDAVVAARDEGVAAARPAGSVKQILFGDLHVHTSYSTDAFQWALPINGGPGVFPVADACDFARTCAALDFWAITDHAEASTPTRWARTKAAVRQCQAVSGDGPNPDLISFLGFEWTQVGRLPDEHYGHKNVIFRDLDDASVAARPISAGGVATTVLRNTRIGIRPGVLMLDMEHGDVYRDFNTFLRKIREVPDCDADTPSDRLPAGCYESAATPGELVRRLDAQKLKPIIIPHGGTWGFYTPPGTTLDKALAANDVPERFPLVEIYSGHGNSEEYRSWREVLPGPLSAAGPTAICPPPSKNYTPSCWRAGEIIAARCQAEGGTDCPARAAYARAAYANMGVAGHLAVKGETPEEWLDAGQCTDCYLPAFNYRPRMSVQYGLAIKRFAADGTQAARWRWGFIGSSDNHRARPGTGYKQVDRRRNTEASGAVSEAARRAQLGDMLKEKPSANATLIPAEKLVAMGGFQLTEFERQTSFFLTGGIAAVHAEGRSRAAIWDAMQRREVYATSGPRIMLWFDRVLPDGRRLPMGSISEGTANPTFKVKAVGAFKQKPGCPDFARAGNDAARLQALCSGECFNPTDERERITRIEVVRIRPQVRAGEDVGGLIEDRFLVHACPPSADGCTFRFSDPGYAAGRRDAIYYVRAIQEATPTINADPLNCTRDAAGKCVKVRLCYGDYRSGASECRAPSEPRAWSSPIYLDWPRAS
ncbi:DUF3604 domain-containing protein [Sandaracinobacteroides saxicola]|uniref:DUF3604 domain-containing protein n=1 Tax=Sandaracinobacteroides saxicola TaxID=2759707 RepID=A0A7G5II37_9SPHN|nr:DUF3604 domain-containing protein [Sandaracinobacteroides saxicola]QMW23029.1 DUF3604 domain-containing protein [Sandaracinobacteroides saxicola]